MVAENIFFCFVLHGYALKISKKSVDADIFLVIFYYVAGSVTVTAILWRVLVFMRDTEGLRL